MVHGANNKVLPVYCSEHVDPHRHMSPNDLLYRNEQAMGLTRLQKTYMS
jgi:hypothetical protein